MKNIVSGIVCFMILLLPSALAAPKEPIVVVNDTEASVCIVYQYLSDISKSKKVTLAAKKTKVLKTEEIRGCCFSVSLSNKTVNLVGYGPKKVQSGEEVNVSSLWNTGPDGCHFKISNDTKRLETIRYHQSGTNSDVIKFDLKPGEHACLPIKGSVQVGDYPRQEIVISSEWRVGELQGCPNCR